MFSDAYTLVWKHPGINTPLICLALHQHDEWGIRATHPEGHNELASWLMKHYRKYWEDTCEVIDRLIEDGKVIFMDDGSIFPAGYFGEGSFTRKDKEETDNG